MHEVERHACPLWALIYKIPPNTAVLGGILVSIAGFFMPARWGMLCVLVVMFLLVRVAVPKVAWRAMGKAGLLGKGWTE